MSQSLISAALRDAGQSVQHFAKIIEYPCGIMDIVASSKPDFKESGWELAGDWGSPSQKGDPDNKKERKSADPKGEDFMRSMRRARAKVRRIALANEFRWFVTLTIDPKKLDRHDAAAVVRHLNSWCSNAVQRLGLRYVLVPERHKDGGLHFHGFFSDSMNVVDSGTIKPPGGGKPRKPRSKAQRQEWLSNGGQIVYNLPQWTLGFTTAMELYGEYPAAVAYVCKYIGKDGDKPAGRWYYSGGSLKEPKVTFSEISPAELSESYGDKVFVIDPPGRRLAIVNGIKVE